MGISLAHTNRRLVIVGMVDSSVAASSGLDLLSGFGVIQVLDGTLERTGFLVQWDDGHRAVPIVYCEHVLLCFVQR